MSAGCTVSASLDVITVRVTPDISPPSPLSANQHNPGIMGYCTGNTARRYLVSAKNMLSPSMPTHVTLVQGWLSLPVAWLVPYTQGIEEGGMEGGGVSSCIVRNVNGYLDTSFWSNTTALSWWNNQSNEIILSPMWTGNLQNKRRTIRKQYYSCY